MESNVLNTMQKVINLNEDAHIFYERACEKAKDPQVKKTFKELSNLHSKVINSLSATMSTLGGVPEVRKTVPGKMAQAWGQLVASLSKNVDEKLIEQLEQTEDKCLHAVQEAVTDKNVTGAAKLALNNELATLRKSHDYMRDLKIAIKAA